MSERRKIRKSELQRRGLSESRILTTSECQILRGNDGASRAASLRVEDRRAPGTTVVSAAPVHVRASPRIVTRGCQTFGQSDIRRSRSAARGKVRESDLQNVRHRVRRVATAAPSAISDFLNLRQSNLLNLRDSDSLTFRMSGFQSVRGA